MKNQIKQVKDFRGFINERISNVTSDYYNPDTNKNYYDEEDTDNRPLTVENFKTTFTGEGDYLYYSTEKGFIACDVEPEGYTSPENTENYTGVSYFKGNKEVEECIKEKYDLKVSDIQYVDIEYAKNHFSENEEIMNILNRF
jgi:hypothetical protein